MLWQKLHSFNNFENESFAKNTFFNFFNKFLKVKITSKKKLRFGGLFCLLFNRELMELILERLGQIHIIFSSDVTKTNDKRAFASKRVWDHISVCNGINFLKNSFVLNVPKTWTFSTVMGSMKVLTIFQQ
ncbi:hypothetical protein RFI_26713, partial [Reticulomyxa filosa]